MRYEEMLQIYPNIENLLSGVSELIHDDNVTADMAAGWAARWISRYIAKEHHQGVTDKALQFIAAICDKGTAKGNTQCNFTSSVWFRG